MVRKKNPPIKLDKEINQKIAIRKNIDDTGVFITKTRLDNYLIKHKAALDSGSDWKTPAGLIVAIVTFFLTGGPSKDFVLAVSEWKAIFVLVLLGSVCWLCRSIYFLFKNKDKTIDSLVDLIMKKESKSD